MATADFSKSAGLRRLNPLGAPAAGNVTSSAVAQSKRQPPDNGVERGDLNMDKPTGDSYTKRVRGAGSPPRGGAGSGAQLPLGHEWRDCMTCGWIQPRRCPPSEDSRYVST